ECLNEHFFISLSEAQMLIEKWRKDYNECRPHSALDGRTPREVASHFLHVPLSLEEAKLTGTST
ncbi:MAG: transposase, partial [Parachlamydiales bacterium]